MGAAFAFLYQLWGTYYYIIRGRTPFGLYPTGRGTRYFILFLYAVAFQGRSRPGRMSVLGDVISGAPNLHRGLNFNITIVFLPPVHGNLMFIKYSGLLSPRLLDFGRQGVGVYGGFRIRTGGGGRRDMDHAEIPNDSFGIWAAASFWHSYVSQFLAVAYVRQLMASYV